MKIESGAGYLLASRNIQARSPTGSVEKTSFAAVLATKAPTVTGAGSVQAAEDVKDVKSLDFSNMTPRDALKVVNKLVLSGQMTLDESSSLLGIIPSPLSKVMYDGLIPESFNQPCNLFEKLQAGLEGAVSRHETASAANMQRGIDALMRFQGKPAGGNVEVKVSA